MSRLTERAPESPSRPLLEGRIPWYAWLVWLVGAAGLCLPLLAPVFPAANVRFTLTRAQVEARADGVLKDFGVSREGLTRTLRFHGDPRISYFMQEELGRELFGRLAREGKLPLWKWRIRHFRAFDAVEHVVSFAPWGDLVAFDFGRSYDEPDSSPEADEAERRCRAFLKDRGFGPHWRVVETKAEQLPARVDRYFIFEAPDDDLGSCRRRAFVKLKGERVAAFRHFLRAPDEADHLWQRNLSYAGVLFHVSMLTDAALLLLAFWQFLLLFKKDEADAATAFRLAVVVFAVLVLAVGNFLPSLVAAGYEPSGPVWAYAGQEFCYYTLASLGIAVAAFLGMAAGTGLAHRTWGEAKAVSMARLLRGHLLDPSVAASLWRGLVFALFLGGAETIFYFVGQRSFGVFLPIRADHVNVLASPLPLLFPLTIGIAASFTEEAVFRLFGTSFFTTGGRPRILAYVVPSLAWAFAHSYEAVFPVYVRGLELFIGGMVFAWVFFRFDMLTVVAAHYFYDVIVYGWALLASGDPWLVANGAVALLPVLLALRGARLALRRD